MKATRWANGPKNPLIILAVISIMCWIPNSFSREDVQSFSIENAMNTEDAKSKLEGVKFAFGTTSIGKVSQRYGEFQTNKKTNAFGKSDERACNWAFLSAMISLHDRAITEGGNAVINIRSNYKNNKTSSETTFQCGAGNVVAGVALIGVVVKID